MIAIIDVCGTNLASVQFALQRLGYEALLTRDAETITGASHVILPGVGTATYAMSQLRKYHLVDVIRGLKQPVLGICLGMQILYEYSAEGDVDCLNIIPGKIVPLANDANASNKMSVGNSKLTIPHMGWNKLKKMTTSSAFASVIDEENNYVYFVHSYAAPVTEDTIATANYGKTFTAIVKRNNYFGVQFHPERSGHVGEKILMYFLNLTKSS